MLSIVTALLVVLGIFALLVATIVVTVLVANGDLGVPLVSRRARAALVRDEPARRATAAPTLF